MAHIFIASYKKGKWKGLILFGKERSETVSSCHLGKARTEVELEREHLVSVSSVACFLAVLWIYSNCRVSGCSWHVIILYCTSTFWTHMERAATLKNTSWFGFFCFCFLTTRDFSSTAHLYGSNSNFPLKPVFFPHELFSSSFRVQERKGGGYMWKEEVDLHVSTSLQTERQAGWEAWGRGAL